MKKEILKSIKQDINDLKAILKYKNYNNIKEEQVFIQLNAIILNIENNFLELLNQQ